MRAEHIESLLGKLGCQRIYRTAGGVRATCPLSSWHSGGSDKHPSFYVYIVDDDMSHCRCMSSSCRFKGSLNELLYKIQEKSRRNMSSLMWFVTNNEKVNFDKRLERIESDNSFYSVPSTDQSKKSSGAAWTGGKDYNDPLVRTGAAKPLPEDHAEHVQRMIGFLGGEALEYLRGPERRFTDETIKKWELGWHPIARRISVPQYDCLNRLVNIGGRFLQYWPDCVPLANTRAPKWMHSLGFKRELYLFGENLFDLSTEGKGTLFLTEGGFDVIYQKQCGLENVAAINGSHINRIQVEKVTRWFDRVVIIMDGDEAGIEAAQRLRQTFSARIDTSVYEIEGGRDPNELENDEIDFLKSRFAS